MVKLFMDTLPGYQTFLESKKLVPETKLSFYLRWVTSFISFCRQEGCSSAEDTRIIPFLNQLAKTKRIGR